MLTKIYSKKSHFTSLCSKNTFFGLKKKPEFQKWTFLECPKSKFFFKLFSEIFYFYNFLIKNISK